jgi:hypothetical protein
MRSQLIRLPALAAGLFAVFLGTVAPRAAAGAAPAPRVRKNIECLSTEELSNLRRAMDILQKRDPSSPDSYGERGLGTEYGAKRQGGSILLTAKGQVPSRGYNVWFELLRTAKAPNQLVLYQKPPANPPGGPPVSFSIRDEIPDPGPSFTSILLEDKNGIQTVPIT